MSAKQFVEQPKHDSVASGYFQVAALSSSVIEGILYPVRILGEDMVLWRSNGKVHAWRDLCIHRGARLSLGTVGEGVVTCAYHGWTYGEDGSCVSIPAHPDQRPPSRARVHSYSVVEKYGFVWVCPGRPVYGVPSFPEWSLEEYRKIHCGPYHVKASAPRLIENFLDVAHLPFVHEGLLGDRKHASIGDYQVLTNEDGITAKNIIIWQPDPDGTGVGSHVTYTYRVFTPFTSYFVKDSTNKGFSIYCSVTPVDTTSSVMWMIIAMNYSPEVPSSQIRAFEDRVVSQDIRVVESQRPELLPLDLQAELHLRSDKTAIAYRRWLKEIGLAFGTE
ncbi:MAG: aromatic ring-hydroxylating dioxygenase subunit alpha [Nitrososphaerota archaeon]|nr:aromatic ring-hydroxylating dioxygenase subunit alpha [Nitrososphaerota archaeon]